jgi:Pregnancy-associated plasma protein-A
MIKIIYSILLTFVFSFSVAQEKKRCASSENNRISRTLKYNPDQSRKIISTLTIDEEKILKIPVVVHVVHNNSQGTIGGQDNGNISDFQIQSQIKVLNEDYRRKTGSRGFNSNPVGVDMRIEFYLATKDPDGKPSTGIVRKFNSKPKFDVFEDNIRLSEISYWDSEKYLNVWVTSLTDDYLGFAEFPTGDFNGLEPDEIPAKIDGIMIDHSVFGSRNGTATKGTYSYGRTLTHEIGHWLGLLHIWGDEFCGEDFCKDTPAQERGNLSTNCNLKYSFCSGSRTLNMSENFLDYTPDSCMNVFTNEQSLRVRAILELSKRRKRLIANSEFNLPEVQKLEIRMLENPSSNQETSLQLLTKAYEDMEIIIYDIIGREIERIFFTDSPSRIVTLQNNKYAKGIFFIKAVSKSGKDIKRLIIR